MKEIKRTYIHNAQEILHSALSQARERAEVEKKKCRNPVKKNTVFTQSKITNIAKHVITSLEKIIEKTPNLDELPQFYVELIKLKVGEEKIIKAKESLEESIQKVKKLRNTYLYRTEKAKKGELAKSVTAYIGRVSNVIKKNQSDLEVLQKTVIEIKSRNILRFDAPSVVITGFPNAGKSTLLNGLSKQKVEVAAYPFTTKKISVGHIPHGPEILEQRIQLIDTPGLLERPLEQKNEIEKESVLAIKHLSDLIIFIYDASNQTNYAYEEQKQLHDDLVKEFNAPLIVLVNKKDDLNPETVAKIKKDYPHAEYISAIQKKDCDKVKELILKKMEYLQLA